MRDRVERGDEIVGTTLDLMATGRKVLPIPLAVSLVVGGLRARWRARPTLWAWWWYALGQELPSQWHRWMLDDLLRAGWCRRVVTRFSVAAASFGWTKTLILDLARLRLDVWGLLESVVISVALGSALGAVLVHTPWATRRRVRILAKNGYDEFGRADPLLRTRLMLEQASRGRRGRDSVAALSWATALGEQMTEAQQLDASVALLTDTFQRAKRLAPEKESPTWRAGYALTLALAEQGRFDDAVPVAREVLDSLTRLNGPEHEWSLGTAVTLGRCLREAGELEESAVLLADTFERAKQAAGEEDWPTWSAGEELLVTLVTEGRANDAVRVGTELLAARRRLMGCDHEYTLATAEWVGETLRLAGRLDDAIELLTDTFERGKLHFPDKEWPTWLSGEALALSLDAAGRGDVAASVRADVSSARRRHLKSRDPDCL